MLTQTLSTLAIFVGAPALIWWLRRKRPDLMGAGMRVTARTALTRNSVVAIVEVDGRRFLLGATDQGINLLSPLDATPPPAAKTTDERQPIDLTDDEEDQTAIPVAALVPGPGKRPIETLRAMTVRKPTRPDFPHAPFRN
jgi:flagellar biogenesis protein FliO